jgi:hypothetical protein
MFWPDPTRYVADGWAVLDRRDHIHMWLVYPQRIPELPAGRRLIKFPPHPNPVLQAEHEAREAAGYYMAFCRECGTVLKRSNLEPKSELEAMVGL